MTKLNTAMVERLFRYYQHLLFKFQERTPGPSDIISSSFIAKALQVDPTQVRKDLAAVNIRGRQRVGYRVSDIVKKIGVVLGLTVHRNAVIVGAGRLGGALGEDQDFPCYGIQVVALFDIDPRKIGREIGGKKVYSMTKLQDIVREHNVLLGLITVPATVAQQTATDLAEAGVPAIWNFAHANIAVPRGVYLRHEFIASGFAELSYFLKRSRR